MSAKVLYEFQAEAGTELSVTEGQTLTIINKDAGEGWWMARNEQGQEGMVPSSYVEEIEEAYQDVPDEDESFSSDGANSDAQWSSWGQPPETPAPSYPNDEATPQHQNATPDAISRSSPSTASEPPNGTLRKTVGKNIIRTSTFIKVGVEDYIIGNVSKKVDEKRYTVEDLANTVEWALGLNYESNVQITATSSKSKLGGMKKFIAYAITHQLGQVERRYKQFDWLDQRLSEQFPCSLRPGLPEKQASGRFDVAFIERRKELLEAWLVEICRHPIISRSPLINGFVTLSSTEEKAWKQFKREQESTPYKIAGFWESVRVPHNSRFIEDGSQQVNRFNKFGKGFDQANTSFANALRKSLKIHDGPQKDELSTLSSSLGKLADEFTTQVIRPNASELAMATRRAADTFKEAADYTTTWAQETTVPLLDHLWIYSGILNRIPQLIETAEQSQQKIKTYQNKVGAGTPEHRELEAKGNTVNGAILAEADYLDQIRIPDYSRFIKNYLTQRAAYHRKQMELFEAAAAEFPD